MRLVVAEKDAAARVYAAESNLSPKRAGPFTYFEGPDLRVISTNGHACYRDLDAPGRWTLNLRRLVRCDLVIKPKDPVFADFVRSMAQGVVEVIIATDNDVQGAIIGSDLVQYVLSPGIAVSRFITNSLRPQDVAGYVERTEPLVKSTVLAGRLRHQMDLRWGAIFTRFLTLLKKDRDVWSAGRVQSSVLGLIVQKEYQIEKFTAQTYVYAYLNRLGYAGETTGLVLGQRPVEVTVKHSPPEYKDLPPPPPLTITDLLVQAASRLKMKPERTMAQAQRLYTGGFISYPRSDSKTYPEGFDHQALLTRLGQLGHVRTTTFPGIGSKTHMPITPLSMCSDPVFLLILQRYVALFKGATRVQRVRSTALVQGVTLEKVFQRCVHEGWCHVKDQVPPPEGISTDVLKVQQRQRKPPPRYGSASLIRQMEKLHMGTKSTRHTYQKILEDRGYITSRSNIRPSDKGRQCFERLKKWFPRILQPALTMELEKDMLQVQQQPQAYETIRQKFYKILEQALDPRNMFPRA